MPRIIRLTARLRAEYRRQMRMRDKRQELIVRHIPQVERIARAVRHLFPPHIPFQDLVQAGCVGLVEAAGRYQPSQGAFDRYCYRRVRGAIIDANKRNNYREETHESFEGLKERAGYLPIGLEVDHRGPRPDEVTLRHQKIDLLIERIERWLPDDERDVLYAALRGVKLCDSAATCGRSISWTRAKLASAKAKVAWKQAA